jgi:hypothetical protein
MAINLKKWKQRNAAERVKAALTRPKKDNTGDRLRRQFTSAAEKALTSLAAKGRHPWLKYGYNEEIVVTARLGRHVIPVTGDEAIALKARDAEAYLRDIIAATDAGQLDRELLKTMGATQAPKARAPAQTSSPAFDSPPQPTASAMRMESPMRAEAPARIQFGLTEER